jgi:hypothetical protein
MDLFRIFLNLHDITPKRLMESIRFFGCNPRRCFQASLSPKLLGANKDRVMDQIKKIAENPNSVIQIPRLIREGSYDLSHTIFQMSPDSESRELQYCLYETISQWVSDTLYEEYEKMSSDTIAILYHQLAGLPWAGSFRGFLLERRVLRYLDGISANHDLEIRDLITGTKMAWTYRGPIPRLSFEEPSVVDKLEDVVKRKKPLHLVPLAGNFPAIDSIVYDPSEGALTCIQVTLNSDHPIAVSGLKRIQAWLKKDTQRARLRPSKEKPWRYIFVVPSDMASSFKPQSFKGDTSLGVWARKVRQYVLGLEVEKDLGMVEKKFS